MRIVSNWTQSIDFGGGAGAIDYLNGCTGDGNDDTIDFIEEITGVDGFTGGVGNTDDASKLRQQPGPINLQITGNMDCGRPSGGAHPDGWQFQIGANRNITIVNGVSGDYDAGTATCQGAGGVPFWTSGSGITFLGGEYVGCNHALNATQAGGTNVVIDAKFRGGRTESVATGGDPNCQGFSGTGGCTGANNLSTFQNTICQNWNASTNTWVTDPNP